MSERAAESGIEQNALKILNKIAEKRKKLSSSVCIVAIDGRCASGKSTMASLLAEKTGAGIIHMDDFFLPLELRTEERLQTPGGNVHYERFKKEVLSGLKNVSSGREEGFAYWRFDCNKMQLAEECSVKSASLYIVEGAYSCHPALGEYMDLKIFFHADEEERLQRIFRRGGEEALRNFRERWIPMEEAYFQAYHIKEKADMVIDSTFAHR